MINKDFDELPQTLKNCAERHYQRLLENVDLNIPALLTTEQSIMLKRAFALSDFVAETLIKYPQWITECLTPAKNISDQQALQELLKDLPDETRLHRVLRHYRHKRMTQIAILDLLNLQPIEASLAAVSTMADALILESYHWLYRQFCQKYNTPRGSMGDMNMLIIGMGKLGGGELNFSSDIDLIFVYPEKGELSYRNKTMEHLQFFTKLAQKLITALHQTTVDGQVFRVDMRLRPFGDSGPLVTSFAALEDYYQSQGREWERYAMVKGRVLNSQDPYSPELQQILQPFVYRRYIDYSVMESLRNMKQLIRQEVRRRHLHNNIKLGSGGIREIEFILQCFQLTRGGRDKALQERNVLTLIPLMTASGNFASTNLAVLEEQYLYLRKTEHCLQQFADTQTQELPDKELDQLRLAEIMGYANYAQCVEDLKRRTAAISMEFENVIGDTQREANSDCSELQDFWLLPLSEDEAVSLIADVYREANADDIASALMAYKTEFSKKPVGVRGKESLDKLMPTLIHDCLKTAQQLPEHTCNDRAILESTSNAGISQNSAVNLLHRVMTVIKAILRRTAYLELLLENQAAKASLIRLCSMSEWVAQQIARFPLLLDELLNPGVLTNPTPINQYPDLLRQQLLRIPEEDLEQQMEALRQFKLSHQLRIAAADLFGALPVMKVSDHLTCLAETIIREAVASAWHQMIEKYGYPDCASDDNTRLLVVGYGKLGGLELGYSSDLDLVFLHDCQSSADTSGPKRIDSRQFYAKLAQRIMHLFNTKTSSGELYEVDLRLRPSGNSGLLVSGIEAFRDYQLNNAWTWEHQALVRSRVVYGNKALTEKFEHIRHDVLSQPRDTHTLQREVLEMRDKMRQHLDKSKGELVDLKQGKGAITDIEFLTQYLTLNTASQHATITRWSDNVRLIETLVANNAISSEWAEELKDAYLKIRNLSHRKALQGTPNVMHSKELKEERDKVVTIWNSVFELTQC